MRYEPQLRAAGGEIEDLLICIKVVRLKTRLVDHDAYRGWNDDQTNFAPGRPLEFTNHFRK
jgi:hypothetical protein